MNFTKDRTMKIGVMGTDNQHSLKVEVLLNIRQYQRSDAKYQDLHYRIYTIALFHCL